MGSRNETGYVYFAERGGLIKIGWSEHPTARVLQLDARLLAFTPGTTRDERALHNQFAGARVEGEWFRVSLDLMHRIVALACAGEDPTEPSAEHDLDRFVTVAEASVRLGIHPDTGRRWIRTGRWEREFPDIPVQLVAGKQQISLRLVVELINARTAA